MTQSRRPVAGVVLTPQSTPKPGRPDGSRTHDLGTKGTIATAVRASRLHTSRCVSESSRRPRDSVATFPVRPGRRWRADRPERGRQARAIEMAETWMAARLPSRNPRRTTTHTRPARAGAASSRPAGRRLAGSRRGRLSREARPQALQVALRYIDSAWELSQSPLAPQAEERWRLGAPTSPDWR